PARSRAATLRPDAQCSAHCSSACGGELRPSAAASCADGPDRRTRPQRGERAGYRHTFVAFSRNIRAPVHAILEVGGGGGHPVVASALNAGESSKALIGQPGVADVGTASRPGTELLRRSRTPTVLRASQETPSDP